MKRDDTTITNTNPWQTVGVTHHHTIHTAQYLVHDETQMQVRESHWIQYLLDQDPVEVYQFTFILNPQSILILQVCLPNTNTPGTSITPERSVAAYKIVIHKFKNSPLGTLTTNANGPLMAPTRVEWGANRASTSWHLRHEDTDIALHVGTIIPPFQKLLKVIETTEDTP